MLKRFIRDESGVALGLAIIMVVLIGVMGAGLLVFVNTDLQNVVEVNGGQKALNAADAGIQAAKRQLLSDASKSRYDSKSPNPDGKTDSAWSSAGAGKDITFNGNTVNVKVQYLAPSATTSQVKDPSYAPELLTSGTNYTNGKNYFKVVSTGTFGEAKRKVEAIYYTNDLGVPKGYFTPNNITINGGASVDGVSLFALGNVTLNGGASVTGTDQIYGNWRNSWNPTPRSTSDAGIGSVGTISGRVAGRDYDSTTCPKFVQELSLPGCASSPQKITFPFDPASQTGQADQDRLNFLREEAKASGAYYPSGGGTVNLGSAAFPWPTNATDRTVVFVDFTSGGGTNRVDWEVGSESDPPVKGTLVVKGGNFRITQHKACLKGVVIVRGGLYEEGTATDAGGNTCLDGFVNASGDIDMKGNVHPLASGEVVNRPGFYGVKLWSWRELYQ